MKRITSPQIVLPHIVVLGAGFGGLQAVQTLRRAPVKVTLIDRNNYHLFQPLLYQVATAGLSADEIAYPIRSIFQNQGNFEFLLGEVQSIDPAAQTLHLAGKQLRYDYLILAAGGMTHHYGNDALKQHAFGLKSLPDAVRLRNHILGQFEKACQETDPEKKQAALTFTIVGGGPSGVESAGAIAELVQLLLRKEYRCLEAEDVRILLLEGTHRLLANLPEELGAFAAKTLQEKGIELQLGSLVRSYDGNQVILANGESIPTHTLLWQAGIQAAEILQAFPAEKDRIQRIRVLPTLQVPHNPNVYAIGDGAALLDEQGSTLPMVAPVAMQQGVHAAKNILRQLQNQPLQDFSYKDPGMMATIGRNKAVVEIGGLRVKGWLAWMIWLVVHILQLIGFRNRIVVLINWAWDYLFYEKTVRLIGPE
jgi:NADH dehydrogenase